MVSALILFFFFSSTLGAQEIKTTPRLHQFQLDNGLTVLVRPDYRANTAVHMLWVRVGSIDEVDGKTGVAHVLEHMAFKGTPTMPAGEFSKRVAALGGEENAFTSYDYTGYYQRVPAARLEEVMELEADRFANLNFDDAEFAKELAVIKEERRMRVEDNPHAAMREMMQSVIYSAAPYRRPVIGWMNDLNALRADDARNFYRQWYAPDNAAVVVVGAVDPQAVFAMAQKFYGNHPRRLNMPIAQRKVRIDPPQKGLRRMTHQALTQQEAVVLAFKIPSLADLGLGLEDNSAQAKEIYALLMLAQVLDGYEGARMGRKLTQGAARVADSAGADMGILGRGSEVFELSATPAPGVSHERVIAALRGEISQIAKLGVSERELQRVKNQYHASRVYALDSLMGQAQEMGSLWAMGFPPQDTAEQLQKQMQLITSADIQAVAQKYFSDTALTIGFLQQIPKKHQ